jgi:glycylpeptide N-tetradecanoyltransferase
MRKIFWIWNASHRTDAPSSFDISFRLPHFGVSLSEKSIRKMSENKGEIEEITPKGDAEHTGEAKTKSKRKKKNKQQAQNEVKPTEAVSDEPPPNEEPEKPVTTAGGVPDSSDNLQQFVRDALAQMKLNPLAPGLLKPAKTPEEALQKSFKFWSTQPVPRMDEKIDDNAPIEADKQISEIKQEPYALPEGFEWDTVSINDPFQLQELYTLLNENYVEDDDAMFRFDYQPNFIKWALQPPGWRQEWHTGVRVAKSRKLVGFISAIPGTLSVYNKSNKMVEINFLCVHKKLRSKRLAPVLIREITRRVNLTGIFQAVYTAGVVLPKPISSCRYWHRSLNPKKLIEVHTYSLVMPNWPVKKNNQQSQYSF